MAFDSTIRLKQLNNPEISGYILGVVGNYLPGETGYYSGAFYPYSTNPSGYIGTGVTGQFANAAAVTTAINSASTQTLTYVALNYLPIGTPLGTGGTGSLIQVTGSSYLTGINFSGINGTVISLSGNYALISASGGGTPGSGSYVFRNSIPSGVNNLYVSFPAPLDANVRIISSLNSSGSSSSLYVQQNTGITSNGFWAIFSDYTDGPDYFLDTIACLSTNIGLATTVIINSGNSNGYSYVTGLTTGLGTSQQFISFPSNFNSIPTVSATLEVTSNILYSWAINARSVSGFNLLLSDDILETGVYLNVICSVI